MKKEYMLSYIIKFCERNKLRLITYDTGVYCVAESYLYNDDFFPPCVDKAYFPSVTKLFYAIQNGDIRNCGFSEVVFPDMDKFSTG